jgi:sulfatase maturation enzyme AslB (radical SAM superfamily)
VSARLLEVILLETAAREFQIMVKTIGAICNLDCHYCYYLQKEELYPKGTNFRLDDETLERYIEQHINATPGNRQFLLAWRRRRCSASTFSARP